MVVLLIETRTAVLSGHRTVALGMPGMAAGVVLSYVTRRSGAGVVRAELRLEHAAANGGG